MKNRQASQSLGDYRNQDLHAFDSKRGPFPKPSCPLTMNATLLVAFGFLLILRPVASVGADRNVAMNNPDKVAWQLFMEINRPASNTERGVPDPGKKLGDDGDVVWETWKSNSTEVFLPDGSKPPPWDESSQPGSPGKPKVFEGSKGDIINALKANPSAPGSEILHGITPSFEPSNPLGDESRMNRAAFEFVVMNDLYNIEGQEELFKKLAANPNSTLQFPIDAKEIKARWRILSADEVAKGADKQYHTHKEGSKVYALMALHIITKDTPTWLWINFRHKETTPEIPDHDTYGMPYAVKGTKWENYRLSGAQVAFVDSTGNPTILSDPTIEKGFEHSSCITCHSFATINDKGRRLPPDDTLLGAPTPSLFSGKNGISTTLKFAQLDFVWSLFRANHKKP
jgi:hypothetical protein